MVIGGTIGLLLILAAVTVFVDPFLHYHAPLSFLEYPLKDERYQNNGIAKNFEYDALITGTSMTQNFKASDFERLWGVKTVKTAYTGATYHELGECIRRALKYKPDLQYVLCSLDGNWLFNPADYDRYEDYPEYLFDVNPLNDVNYVLNKEVVPKTIAVINYTRAGEKTPTMDEYGNWNDYMTFGREAVFSSFTKVDIREEEVVLSEEDLLMVRESIEQNYLSVALENPETEFYFFLPPYSICCWEAWTRTKQLKSQLQAEEVAVKLLLSAENMHVYSFEDRIDIIGNLDNYGDTLHYGEWINEEILQCIYEGKGELTLDNVSEFYDQVYELYANYEYVY